MCKFFLNSLFFNLQGGCLMKNFRNSKSGFTLIELMIVVVIIGILAAIAIPNFLKVQNKAKCKACIANLKQILDAANKYMTDTSADVSSVANLVAATGPSGYDGPYLKSIPANPFNNDSNATAYVISTSIANGKINVAAANNGVGKCCVLQ